MTASKLVSITAEYDDGRKLVLDIPEAAARVDIDVEYSVPSELGGRFTHTIHGLDPAYWRELPAPEPLPACHRCGYSEWVTICHRCSI